MMCERLRLGWSDKMTIEWAMDEFGVKEVTAKNYLKKAYAYLGNCNSEFKAFIQDKQSERFEYILRQAIEAGKWDVANRILDNMNKMYGLYQTGTNIEITSDTIQFKFGSDDTSSEDNNIIDADVIESPDNQ